MSPTNYTEQDFEEHIEAQLKNNGYHTVPPTEFDKTLCLIPSKLIELIKLIKLLKVLKLLKLIKLIKSIRLIQLIQLIHLNQSHPEHQQHLVHQLILYLPFHQF